MGELHLGVDRQEMLQDHLLGQPLVLLAPDGDLGRTECWELPCCQIQQSAQWSPGEV
jgi:hypothetical protein